MQSNAGSVDASDVISNINTKASDKQAHLHEIDANDERLYEEIRACEHWQDVVEIVSDELLQADGIHCSTKRAVQALVRLSALSTLPSPRLATSSSVLSTDNPVLLALLDLIYSRVPSMKVTQLSATLAALSKLKIQVPVAPLSSICKKCGLAAVQMSARDVVTVINSLASLKASPEMGDMDRLGFRAYSLLRDQLSTADDDTEAQKEGGSRRHLDDAASINSQGISLLFYSSASLGYMNSKLISVASEAAMANLQNFTPLGVSNILWACGKMHHYDEKLVEACLEHVSEKIESYAPREAATIMWALAQLKHHPQEASRPLLSALLARLPSTNILDISSSLLCLATFSINPGKQSMSKICNR